MDPRPLLLALLASLLPAASGCLEGDGDRNPHGGPTEADGDGGDGGTGPGAPPPPFPEDVLVEETIPLTEGASREWAWSVAPGFASARLELHVQGPQGAPTYSANGMHYRLESGGMRLQGGGNGGVSLETAPSRCLLCHDLGAGAWVLGFGAGPSLAEAHVRIAVTYPTA